MSKYVKTLDIEYDNLIVQYIFNDAFFQIYFCLCLGVVAIMHSFVSAIELQEPIEKNVKLFHICNAFMNTSHTPLQLWCDHVITIWRRRHEDVVVKIFIQVCQGISP